MILDRIWSIYEPAMSVLIERIKSIPSVESARTREQRPLLSVSDDGLATIPIVGPMVKGAPDWAMEWYGLAGTGKIREAVEAAAQDKSIKAIVIRIDTPGGSVDGLADLGDSVYRASQIKPTVSQVEGMAASAGYYVASQTQSIRANRMDLVGSIGTRMTLWDTSKMFEDAGIKVLTIDSAPEDRPFKSAGEDGTAITDQQQEDFQRIVDTYFSDFRSAVIRGRRMSNEQFDGIADGRVWPATEAIGLGLIDSVGSINDTMSAIRGGFLASARQRLSNAKLSYLTRAQS